MTSVRQILRCARKLGQVQDSGAKVLNRSVRCAATQTQQKIIQEENGKKIFRSPYGEISYTDMLIHEYVWKNLADHANRTALVCSVTGKKYTYSEARDATNYIARSLINMGLRKGDTVALVAPNYPDTILAFLGILEADLVVTTVNPFYTIDEIKKQLQSSGAKAIITVAEIAQTALAAAKGTLAPGAPFVVIDDGTASIPQGSVPLKDLIVKGKSLPPLKNSQSSMDDLAVLPYSSGTTGLPKGVMLTHRNLVANMEMVEHTAKGRMWPELEGDSHEVLPLILPFFHIYGLNSAVLPRLFAGSKIITLPRFTPELFISVLEEHRATCLFLAPPLLLFFNASPHMKKKHFECMHHAISGAAPMSNLDVQRFYEKFQLDNSRMKFCQGYGLTECAPVVCLETTGLKPGGIGKNIAGCDVRLVSTITNEDVSSPGETGELWVRGPHIMKGYLNNESATRETIVENGWLKTGDIGYYDKDFDFFITDRLKELIKVKGFQVAPAELESLLRTHPKVQEAAVVGIPDQRCGEVPKAFILPKEGAKVSEDDIKNFVKGKVSDYKELRGGVTFVDCIPKNPSGKILRNQLRKTCK